MNKKTEKRKERSRFRILVLVFIAAFIMTVAGDMLHKDFGGYFIKEATMENGRELILVNSENKVPEDFETELVTLTNGEKVDSLIYPRLQEMFDDMRAEGYYPQVVSGYRDSEKQEDIFENKYAAFRGEGYSKKEARKLTEKWVAEPGTSEHETGLAVDINPDREKSGNEVYKWLEKNAHKYGFIKRYPEEKTEITGIADESWHYRYVGEKAAKVMKEKNLCLEEYIEYIS
ncbi:MAG: M15 family metallopeptidase [Clostridia bacterium]|nr:M15 family metallopeptidase [Clostridia bacterium]